MLKIYKLHTKKFGLSWWTKQWFWWQKCTFKQIIRYYFWSFS